MSTKKYLLNQEEALLKLKRLALEVAESLSGDDAPVVVIGIRNSGTVIANRIAGFLGEHIGNPVQCISASLDKSDPGEVTLSEKLSFNNIHVLLADDVTNSGRTLLYALKPLLDYHPRSIRTLVLVERMHKVFPIKPDYVGLSVATTLQDHIQVEVSDEEVTGAYVM